MERSQDFGTFIISKFLLIVKLRFMIIFMIFQSLWSFKGFSTLTTIPDLCIIRSWEGNCVKIIQFCLIIKSVGGDNVDLSPVLQECYHPLGVMTYL